MRVRMQRTRRISLAATALLLAFIALVKPPVTTAGHTSGHGQAGSRPRREPQMLAAGSDRGDQLAWSADAVRASRPILEQDRPACRTLQVVRPAVGHR